MTTPTVTRERMEEIRELLKKADGWENVNANSEFRVFADAIRDLLADIAKLDLECAELASTNEWMRSELSIAMIRAREAEAKAAKEQ